METLAEFKLKGINMSDVQNSINIEGKYVYEGWMRIIFGAVACALPILVWLTGLIELPTIIPLPSISAYYHSNARDLFEGLLFWASLSLLIFSIVLRQLSNWHDKLNLLASIFLLSVAIFPCNYNTQIGDRIGIFLLPENISEGIHMVVAILFFLLMLLSCLYFFNVTTKQSQLKVLYLIGAGMCFIVILVYMSRVAGILTIQKSSGPIIFFIEFAGLLIIGICWIMKGLGEITNRN